MEEEYPQITMINHSMLVAKISSLVCVEKVDEFYKLMEKLLIVNAELALAEDRVFNREVKLSNEDFIKLGGKGL